jgi:hypothetical protein
VKLRLAGVSLPSEAGAKEGERRDQAGLTWPWALASVWAGSGQEERKGKEESSWAEATAGPPALLDRAERERSKGGFLLF